MPDFPDRKSVLERKMKRRSAKTADRNVWGDTDEKKTPKATDEEVSDGEDNDDIEGSPSPQAASIATSTSGRQAVAAVVVGARGEGVGANSSAPTPAPSTGGSIIDLSALLGPSSPVAAPGNTPLFFLF
jgi:hypothetical protein